MEDGKKKMHHIFWQLFKGYWYSEEKLRACGLFAVVILLNMAAVYLLVQLNAWYKEFYNVLQGYTVEFFWPSIGKLTLLASLYIALAVYAIYLRQMLQIKWRIWMTDHYLANWLGRQVYYRMQVLGSDTDNPDQRISEDISQFVNLTMQLLVGTIQHLMTLGAFAVVLWNLSGVLTVPVGGKNVQIYGYMLWFSLFYAVVGTYLAHRVGRRLVGLDFDQQHYEADFRFNMMRVRENSESVAFYGGEKPELQGFKARFVKVVSNYWGLMRQMKLLNFYVNGYGQLAIIVPILMAAPRYFSHEMQLGGFMQTLSAFGRVQDALSYFVNSYDNIAQLAAVTRRLSSFTEHMEQVCVLESKVTRSSTAKQQLELRNLCVELPAGQVLVQDASLILPVGSRTLITGNSGCGKSTLLRTLAGIWPFGRGELVLPEDETVLFLPQRPYLPLGTLRRAVEYPLLQQCTEARLQAVLRLVGMEHLTGRLDEIADWSRILSLGEQQRIAFARVLLVKPQWVFLDEATSALDEPREKDMYELLRQELPTMGIISVGHRSTLFAQHQTEWHLAGDGSWQVRPIME